MVQLVWKTLLQFLIKLNIHYHPAILLLSIYQREMKVYVHKKTYMRMFRTVLFIITKIWNQFGSTTRKMDRQNGMHSYNGILLNNKGNKPLLNTTWMNLKTINLNEISLTQEQKIYSNFYIKFQNRLNLQQKKIKQMPSWGASYMTQTGHKGIFCSNVNMLYLHEGLGLYMCTNWLKLSKFHLRSLCFTVYQFSLKRKNTYNHILNSS